MNKFLPYLALAFICSLASVIIVFIAMMTLGQNGATSEGNLYGVAAMAAGPAVLGMVIVGYLPRDDQ